MITSSRPGQSRWLKRMLGLPRHVYRQGLGWMLGHRFLLLTHSGRRTGRKFSTVLEVVRFEHRTHEATVLAGFGSGSDWLRNIQANGLARVAIARESFDAAVRMVGTDEAIAVFEEYEQRNRFARPVVRAVLSRLLGWRYDGSKQARQKMADQLPMIAFRPR